MHFEITFVVLFAVATAVAIAARRLRVPYTVSLVLAGLVLGTAHALAPPHLTKELLFAVVLPGLVFEAAFHLDLKRFLNNKIVITSLALPGVIASLLITAAIMTPAAGILHLADGFTFMHALVFGALISATDPIAVVGLFKTLGVPKRLSLLVEGESLLNDGTAVVLFTLILGAIGGAEFSFAHASIDFVRVVGMGLLVGLAVGFGVSQVIHQVDDPMVEITLTTIGAYGSFVIAEQFHYSGVIATVTAGMLCGNYAARTGMTASTRVAVESFWEYMAFALNSLVFLLIGFEVRISSLLSSWKAILIAYLAVNLGRALVVFLVSGLLRRTYERLPWKWNVVMTWGGLKGALSMVLVLGLPLDFPHRDLLVTMTFGVVLLSILGQGLTMSPLMKWLGLVDQSDTRVLYEMHLGALKAANAALEELKVMDREQPVPGSVLKDLEREYEEKVRKAQESIRALKVNEGKLLKEEKHRAQRYLLLLEKERIVHSYHKGHIGTEAYEKLLARVDAQIARLEEYDETPTTEAPGHDPDGQRSDKVGGNG